MENLLNQYSYVIISLSVLAASLILLRRYNADRRVIAGAMALLLVLVIAGNFLLRPGQSDIDSVDAAQMALHNGRPTFIEFFSNYCASCLALRPAVDLLVSEIEEDYNILRIDIHTDFGRELRQSFDFNFTPEFVLFDRNGQEVLRSHSLPPRDKIFALVPGLNTTS